MNSVNTSVNLITLNQTAVNRSVKVVAIPSEDERFNYLYNATISYYRLNPGAYPCSTGSIKRWADLAEIWRAFRGDRGNDNMFFNAFHNIYWGCYPDWVADEEKKSLLAAVETELLLDGNAFKAWKSSQMYSYSFFLVARSEKATRKNAPRIYTESFRAFLRCRFWIEVVYKKKAPPQINLATTSKREIHSIHTHAEIYDTWVSFEYIVKRLIPESADWSRAEWSDDRNIYRTLKKRYRINYRNCPGDFDSLIALLREMWCHGSQKYLRHTLLIENMPLTLASVIWPNNTQKQVEKMFSTAYSRVKAVEKRQAARNYHSSVDFSFSNLRKSWLYKQVETWVYTDTVISKDMKKIVFDLSIMSV